MMERTGEEWAQACGLKKKGREWVGPCPLCGGEDRFHVHENGTKVLVGCRGCIDGRDPAERHRRYGELTRAVFGGNGTSTNGGGHWFDEHRSQTLKRGRGRDSAVSNRDPSHTTTRFNSRPIKPGQRGARKGRSRQALVESRAVGRWHTSTGLSGRPASVAAGQHWPGASPNRPLAAACQNPGTPPPTTRRRRMPVICLAFTPNSDTMRRISRSVDI